MEAWVWLLIVAAQFGAKLAAPQSPEGAIPACIPRFSSPPSDWGEVRKSVFFNQLLSDSFWLQGRCFLPRRPADHIQ